MQYAHTAGKALYLDLNKKSRRKESTPKNKPGEHDYADHAPM